MIHWILYSKGIMYRLAILFFLIYMEYLGALDSVLCYYMEYLSVLGLKFFITSSLYVTYNKQTVFTVK